jgi:hypothetical protein
MIETQLIFVEGLPGLGKSTTSYWLANLLQSEGLQVQFYEEHQPGHPLNVGGDLHPAGDLVGDVYFQQYTPESFIQESLSRWQGFVQAAMTAGTIHVLDSYPFQNSARILLQMNAATQTIETYTDQVEALGMPLQPVLIYLSHSDLAHAIQHMDSISAQRGQEWKEYVVKLITHSPYATARHLEGYGGVTQFISDYKRLSDALLQRSHLPRLVLESCTGKWDVCYQRIEAFLQLG